MKITKLEKYYGGLINNNEDKKRQALIGVVGSVGASMLLSYCNVTNLNLVGDPNFLDIARTVIISLSTTYAGIFLNASINEYQEKNELLQDFKKITYCLKTNDAEAMAEFLNNKYPGIYKAIVNQVQEKSNSGGMTK